MRRLRALLFGVALSLGIALGFHAPASATNQTPTQSYCMAWAALHNVLIASWTNPLYLGIGCGFQPGDLYTDGPIFDPTLTGISGRNFTIPANTYIAQGQRVVTQANATSAPNNITSYQWLDCNGCSGVSYGTWESTTSSTPPHSYSSLMYTVVAASGVITGFFPTFASLDMASGWLQVGNSTANAWNQSVFTAGSPSPSQVLFTNSTFAGNIGNQPYFLTQSLDALDCTSTGPEHFIQAWKNADGPQTTPFEVGCSTDITPGDIELAINVNGKAQFTGPINDNFLPTPGPSPSPSVEPICGSGAFTGYLNWCPNGLVLANIVAQPAPIATASMIPWTNSAAGGTTTGLFNMQGTNAGCVFGGGGANNIVFAVEDNAATNLFRVMCSGNAVVNRLLNTNSLIIGGLGSGTVGLLCGANATAVSQCTQQSPFFATTGNTSVATGTTANTYQQLGSNVSITTGTSTGANGNWLVTTVQHMSIASGVAENIYGCITSASTFSTQDADVDGATGNCVTAKANSFAGGPPFGASSSAINSFFGLSQTITATVTVANSTTFTASCFVAGSTVGSITVFGYCHTTAIPN